MQTAEVYARPADAAVEAAKYVVRQGGHSKPRDMAIIECLWCDFNVLQPESIPFTIVNRDLNPRYAALEICSLLAGTPVDAHQRHTAKGFAAYQDYSIQRGNYGVRIRNQLRDFVWRLGITDPHSRQAVLTIFDGERDMKDNSKDIPCTLSIQGFVRENTFYMKTTMRSNDAYLGLPYDLMQFCALQTTLSEILLTTCGFYRHSAGSLHVYLSDISKVEALEAPEPGKDVEDSMWDIPDELVDPRDRLEYVVQFCQDALYGCGPHPSTEFEHWLMESL